MKIALGRDLSAVKAELQAEIDAAAEAERLALADSLSEQSAEQWRGRLLGIDMKRLRAKRAVERSETVSEARRLAQSYREDT